MSLSALEERKPIRAIENSETSNRVIILNHVSNHISNQVFLLITLSINFLLGLSILYFNRF